jgi:hypothetical protein
VQGDDLVADEVVAVLEAGGDGVLVLGGGLHEGGLVGRWVSPMTVVGFGVGDLRQPRCWRCLRGRPRGP